MAALFFCRCCNCSSFLAIALGLLGRIVIHRVICMQMRAPVLTAPPPPPPPMEASLESAKKQAATDEWREPRLARLNVVGSASSCSARDQRITR